VEVEVVVEVEVAPPALDELTVTPPPPTELEAAEGSEPQARPRRGALTATVASRAILILQLVPQLGAITQS
jgi:hypothetical protein